MQRPPTINVEFYGVPRQRAGIQGCTVAAATLGEALAALAARYPEMAAACLVGDAAGGYRLHDAYTANLNAERFLRDAATPLADGDTLLILSTDAGG